MNWRNLDIEQKLREGKEVPSSEELYSLLDRVWTEEHISDVSVLLRLKERPVREEVSNHFNLEEKDYKNIFHINDIKKICIDYRLRFLSTHYFKGDIPHEAISKIKDLERRHNTFYKGFKIMAPSKMFKLSNADDPLLFIPINKNHYYLVHKWGEDLAWYRKIWAWCFKKVEHLLLVCLIVSFMITYLIPEGLFFPTQHNFLRFFIEFLFMFKSIVAVVIYYAFAKGKNFNTAIWNSKYFNA